MQEFSQSLCHHPRHHVLPAFHDDMIAASLVLRQAETGGVHWSGPDGMQVWVDGEAFDDQGLVSGEELANQIGTGSPRLWNGAFSAVIYDAARAQLRFLTDPFGLKYLYLRTAGIPAWSGELHGFLNLPGTKPRLNPTCLSEFLEYGHPLGPTAWFQGVEMLPPGSVFTYDLRARRWKHEQYYPLEKLGNASKVLLWDQTVIELGDLFHKAVARRCGGHKRVGLTLSGGLDSRAILAAMPRTLPTPETLTFGKPGCADEKIAKRAAYLRGAHHTFIPLGGPGWLEARAKDVLLTEGNTNILDLHGMESLPALEERMDFCLNGFLGDGLLGGRWTAQPDFANRYRNRGRRFVLQALHHGGTSIQFRMPFLDFPLMEKTLSLPQEWLRGSRIYNAMLLGEFPEFFRSLPWEKTGLSISAPRWREFVAIKMRGLRRRLGIDSDGYANYPRWLREGQAAEFLRARLDYNALVGYFLAPGEIQTCLQRHFQGHDESTKLGRYLTAEIWLRFLKEQGVELNS